GRSGLTSLSTSSRRSRGASARRLERGTRCARRLFRSRRNNIQLTARLTLAFSWLVVILCALGFHPALREGAPLAGLGRHIAEDAAQARGEFESLGPLAFWALDLSLLYVAGWGLVLLCPRRVDTPLGVPATLLISVVVGQAAACLAGSPVGFYFLAAGI